MTKIGSDWNKWLRELSKSERYKLDKHLTALLKFDKVKREFKDLNILLSLLVPHSAHFMARQRRRILKKLPEHPQRRAL